MNDAQAQSITGCSGYADPFNSGAGNTFTVGGVSVNVCDLERTGGGAYTHTLACHAESVCTGGQAGDDLTMHAVYDFINAKYAVHGNCNATSGAIEFCSLIDDPYGWVETFHVYGTPIHDDISLYYNYDAYLTPAVSDLVARVYGDAGDDDLTGVQSSLTAEELWGGTGSDFIDGAGGATAIHGNDGTDYLVHADVMYGEADADFLVAGQSGSTLWGGAAGDTFCGYTNATAITKATAVGSWSVNCVINAGNGSTMHGGDGNDTMYGAAGNDDFYGDDGDDVMYGYNGADNFDARTGSDYASGGSGTDQFCTSGANDEVHGGNDKDTLWASPVGQTFINSSSLDDPSAGNCGVNGTGDESNSTGGSLGGVECAITTSCPL